MWHTEQLVSFACILTDEGNATRTGGCVSNQLNIVFSLFAQQSPQLQAEDGLSRFSFPFLFLLVVPVLSLSFCVCWFVHSAGGNCTNHFLQLDGLLCVCLLSAFVDGLVWFGCCLCGLVFC